MECKFKKYKDDWDFMYSTGVHDSITRKNFPIPFFQIIGLFAEDANYELRKCYVHQDRLFIEGFTKGEKNELMLRYNHDVDNNLVVARVAFIHQRKGKMTELYRILKRIRHKYHTGPIVIESVQSKEMEEWCIKNKFVKNGGSYYQPK